MRVTRLILFAYPQLVEFEILTENQRQTLISNPTGVASACCLRLPVATRHHSPLSPLLNDDAMGAKQRLCLTPSALPLNLNCTTVFQFYYCLLSAACFPASLPPHGRFKTHAQVDTTHTHTRAMNRMK